MGCINEGDPWKPVLVIEPDEESKKAIEALKRANIDFEVWVAGYDTAAVGRPPYVNRGQYKYVGLKSISEFIESYPGMLKSERASCG